MYDPKSEAKEFIGETREEAIAKACSYFDMGEDDLKIAELDPTTVSGLGARVVVVAQSASAAANRGSRRGGRGGREGGREGRREEGREGREGRGDEERPRREGRGRGERSDRSERFEERPAREEPTEPSVGTVSGELGDIGGFVLGVVERMQVGPFEIRETEDEKYVVLQLSGVAAQALSAGEGKAADALQLLANQAAMRAEESPKRIVVDAEGDPERRQDFLSRIADRAARRARDTGRSVALEAMNGRDRRAIHVALREADGIATMSIGEGRYRQVVVVPEGAPDYEEARRASEEAASQDG